MVDEHKSKGKTPEELVQLKIINPDQKKQVDNLNSLKAEVARLEEQLAQYEKIDGEYRAQVASVKADIEKSHEQDKADAVAEVKKQAEADAKKSLHDGLLVLSQFLRLAAHRRAEAPESAEDEDQALEGILLGVYGGDEAAVNVMLRLCEGTEDKTIGVGGETLETSCEFEHCVWTAVSGFLTDDSQTRLSRLPLPPTRLPSTRPLPRPRPRLSPSRPPKPFRLTPPLPTLA